MKPALPKRILGYRRRDVDEYIEIAARDAEAVVSKAQDELRSALESQGALVMRLDEQRKEFEAYGGRSVSCEKAMQKAQAIAECVIEAAKYKAENIAADGQIYADEQRLYIVELDRQIASVRKEIEAMGQSVRHLVEARCAPLQMGHSTKVAGHILEASGRNAPFTATTSSGFLEVDVSIQAVKVVSQDGEEIGRVRSLVLDKVKDRVCGYEINPHCPESPLKCPAIVPSSAVIAVKRDALVVHSSWVRELKRVPAPAAIESWTAVAEPPPDAVEPKIAAGLLEEVRAGLPSAPPAVANITGDTPEPVVTEPAAASVKAEPVSDKPASEAVAPAHVDAGPQIGAGRMKYLVGRISGTDVRDLDGSLIVARGSAITAEIVERAKNAGKLAELIVNMTIPGLSLDEEAASGS